MMLMMMIVFLCLGILGVSQPMSMVALMVMITLEFMFLMYIYLKSMWFGYLLMLVILSGIMVVFSYMASMTPNEKFELWGVVVMTVVVGSWSFLFMGGYINFSFSSLSLWEGCFLLMNLTMLVILLSIMVMAVWVSDWWAGPARV